MPTYKNRTAEETLCHQSQKSLALVERALKAANRLPISDKRRQRLKAVLGVEGMTPELLLSDLNARVFAAKKLFEVTSDYLTEFVPHDVPLYHLTLVDDIGLTSDRCPVFKFAALKRKVDKALRFLGVSGIAMLEVQPLTNYPGCGEGRSLMVHAHALCWGNVSRRDFREAKAQLNQSRAWKNQFDAKPIVSRRLRSIDDALKIVCYLAKMPHDGKYRVPVAKGKYHFKPTLKGYPNNLALRVLEGLSHYSIDQAVFAVGDAKVIRSTWKRELVNWHRDRLSNVDPEDILRFKVDVFWKNVRAVENSTMYEPYAIL